MHKHTGYVVRTQPQMLGCIHRQRGVAVDIFVCDMCLHDVAMTTDALLEAAPLLKDGALVVLTLVRACVGACVRARASVILVCACLRARAVACACAHVLC